MQELLEPGKLSPRHLAAQGITSVDEWNDKVERRRADKAATNIKVLDPATCGEDKMHAQCVYIFKYGKTLFSCPRCWLLPGLCICSRLAKCTPKTKVVVHVHQLEWGKSSNSGSVLGVTLENSEVLLKGLKEHDVRINEIFQDPTVTTAVLWPGADSILPSELKALADERSGGRLTVVAVDATWGNARRTRTSYPVDTIYVKLTPDSAIINEKGKSLLAPIRKYRGDVESNARTSTLEAVASLLYELEGCEKQRLALLGNLKMKVDACMLQKSRTTAHGTLTDADFFTF